MVESDQIEPQIMLITSIQLSAQHKHVTQADPYIIFHLIRTINKIISCFVVRAMCTGVFGTFIQPLQTFIANPLITGLDLNQTHNSTIKMNQICPKTDELAVVSTL